MSKAVTKTTKAGKAPLTKSTQPTVKELGEAIRALREQNAELVAMNAGVAFHLAAAKRETVHLNRELVWANRKSYALQEALSGLNHTIAHMNAVTVRPDNVGDPRKETQVRMQTQAETNGERRTQ